MFCQAVFNSVGIILHSQQQRIQVPVASFPQELLQNDSAEDMR